MRTGVFVVVAILLLAGPVWGYRTWVRRISQSWPVAEAKLESGDVSASGRRYVLRVRYSYSVSKGLYAGEYYKYFRTQAEADYLWKSLSSMMPLVRYDARNPTRSYFDPYRDVRVGELGASGRISEGSSGR